MMARDVYTDREFIKFSRSQVFVRVFEDANIEGARLARGFQIEGTPTLIVLDSSGKEIDRLVGGMNAHELIEALNEIFQTSKLGKYKL